MCCVFGVSFGCVFFFVFLESFVVMMVVGVIGIVIVVVILWLDWIVILLFFGI